MRDIKYLTIHCSAGLPQQMTSSIIDYWRNVLGWSGMGYHWIIDADGTATRLTADDKIANGVKGFNHNSIHICYKGGWNGKDTRTEAQKEAILKLLKSYKKIYHNALIKGHRDFSPDLNKDGKITPDEFVKLCPCYDVTEEYKNVDFKEQAV